MSTEDDIRKGILEELGDEPAPTKSADKDLANADPDILWQRAQAHKRRAQKEHGGSWELVFRLWLWLQAIPACVVLVLVLYVLVSDPKPADKQIVLLSWALVPLFYWVPTLVAHKRDRANKWAITLLNNFLTGWTFVGWVIAIVWSVSEGAHKQAAR